MITQHQYLEKYPIAGNSKILILGTIHPHETEKFKLPFFYGNKNSIWNILSDAFPEELNPPITLNGVLIFLYSRKIAVSDTIVSCTRIKPTALDKDLKPLQLHLDLINQIRNSKIERIYCTSGFGKNNAFKLFYSDLLHLKITSEIRKSKQILLEADFFGRPILISQLFSPSGAANISLSKNAVYLKEVDKYIKSHRPVHDFKVDFYRQQFSI